MKGVLKSVYKFCFIRFIPPSLLISLHNSDALCSKIIFRKEQMPPEDVKYLIRETFEYGYLFFDLLFVFSAHRFAGVFCSGLVPEKHGSVFSGRSAGGFRAARADTDIYLPEYGL